MFIQLTPFILGFRPVSPNEYITNIFGSFGTFLKKFVSLYKDSYKIENEAVICFFFISVVLYTVSDEQSRMFAYSLSNYCNNFGLPVPVIKHSYINTSPLSIRYDNKITFTSSSRGINWIFLLNYIDFTAIPS